MNNNMIKTLNNDIGIPLLGFGTYKLNNQETTKVVSTALQCGYRHIDTASYYNNEEAIGTAIKTSGIPREDLFLTSKVWNSQQGYENTLKAFNESIKKLGTDYLDLYLIHWPTPMQKETWRAMEKLHKEGYIRSLGVSNFTVKYLQDILQSAEVKPVLNQVEFHPYLVQKDLINYCRQENIHMEAWSPLMRGGILNIDLLKDLSVKYNKSIPQIVLRWDIQMGFSTIPKTTSRERMLENMNIFDFEIEEEDISRITSLNKDKRISRDPEVVYNDPMLFDRK